MKRTLIISLLLLSLSSFSQNSIFSEDKIDDMTGKKIRRTSWLVLRMEANRAYYTRLCQIDSTFFLDLKILVGSYVSVEEDADFIIKFSDNSTLILKNHKYISAGLGDGAIGMLGSEAPGINPRFILTKEQLETLAKKEIIKIRLYLNDGYIETELKSNKATVFKEHCIQLYIRIFPS